MHIYEKMRRQFFVEYFDNPLTLSKIIVDLMDYLDKNNVEKETFEFLHYILKDGLGFVTVEKENRIFTNAYDEELIYFVMKDERIIDFYLNEKGKAYSLNYIKQGTDSIKEVLLLFENKEIIGLGDIFLAMNKIFNFNDFEEFKFESDNIANIIYLCLFDIGSLNNNIFKKWGNLTSDDDRTEFINKMRLLRNFPKNGDVGWLKITDKGRKFIEYIKENIFEEKLEEERKLFFDLYIKTHFPNFAKNN